MTSSIIGAIDRTQTSGRRRGAEFAAAITRTASAQSYYTIRLLADRDRAADAYRAYAYFRWADDVIDDQAGARAETLAFLHRQQSLLAGGYRGLWPADLCPEERLLAELVDNDGEADSGLRAYLENMMAVMAFDAARRGRLITAAELDYYVAILATAVSEALLHFIGHDSPPLPGEARSLAVRGANVIHMLRDAVEDVGNGYFNIPAEYLAARGITVDDLDHPAYREWVAGRVALARDFFRQGRVFLAGLSNPRCRLAGYAYIARFEWMARLIERDGYRLRPAYPERKSVRAALWMGIRTITNEK